MSSRAVERGIAGVLKEGPLPGGSRSLATLGMTATRVMVRERLPRGAVRSARAVQQWSDLAAVPEIQDEPRQE